jgi:hypothetical protein
MQANRELDSGMRKIRAAVACSRTQYQRMLSSSAPLPGGMLFMQTADVGLRGLELWATRFSSLALAMTLARTVLCA